MERNNWLWIHSLSQKVNADPEAGLQQDDNLGKSKYCDLLN